MPEIVSMTMSGFLLGSAVMNRYSRGSTAISEEAGVVSKNAMRITSIAEQSYAINGRVNLLVSALSRLVFDHARDEPDVQVSKATVVVAVNFLKAIPSSWSEPELAVEPDGAISVDWYVSRHRQLSVSVSERRRLAFAWLNGASRGHGVAQFDGLGMPVEMLSLHRSVTSNGDSFIWSK